MRDEQRKQIIVLAAIAGVIVGGIILWFIMKSRELDGAAADGSEGRGPDWGAYDPWQGGGGNGYGNGDDWNGNGGNGYGNGDDWNGNGGNGYGNGDDWNGNGGNGYGNGDGWNGNGGNGYGNGDDWNGNGGNGYGNGDDWNGNGGNGYGNGDGWNGNGGNGYQGDEITAGGGGRGLDHEDADYQSEESIFGDTAWEDYVTGLFRRISPDYAVDALEVLHDEGVELFIRAAELCGTDGTASYEALSETAQARWDTIAAEVHAARYLYELDEIVLRYTLSGANWRGSRESAEFQEYLEQNITDRAAREAALEAGSYYHIITELEGRMAGKALGYTYREAMERVLLTAGDPLAEVVTRQEDYVPVDEGGNPLVDVPEESGGITVTVTE